jgi:hypothetical protein
MKQVSTVTTVIIAAAVLVAAYAIGVLVREIRMGSRSTGSDVAVLDQGATPPGPGTGRAGAVKSADPLETRQEKEKVLKKMSNLTQEQKERFKAQVRDSVTPSGKEQNRNPILRERDKRIQKWQSMSPEEKKAFEAQMKQKLEEAPQQQGASPDANQPASTTVEQGVKEDGSKTKGAAQDPASKSNQ